MESINAMVSDEAKKVVTEYQKKHKLSRIDKALDALLLEWNEEHNKPKNKLLKKLERGCITHQEAEELQQVN